MTQAALTNRMPSKTVYFIIRNVVEGSMSFQSPQPSGKRSRPEDIVVIEKPLSAHVFVYLYYTAIVAPSCRWPLRATRFSKKYIRIIARSDLTYS